MFSRGLIEGEAGKQVSERSANVQTPQAPQTQTKTATRQQKKERKKSTRRFRVSSPGVEFRVENPSEKRRRISMEKCLNVHANGVWNYDDYY